MPDKKDAKGKPRTPAPPEPWRGVPYVLPPRPEGMEIVSIEPVAVEVPPPQPANLWQQITPWKEELGETFGSAVAGVFQTVGEAELRRAEIQLEQSRAIREAVTSGWEAYRDATVSEIRKITPWEEDKDESLMTYVRDLVIGEPPTTSPEPLELPSGAQIVFEGDPVRISEDDRVQIIADAQLKYPELKAGDTITMTYTQPKPNYTGEFSFEVLGHKISSPVSWQFERDMQILAELTGVLAPPKIDADPWSWEAMLNRTVHGAKIIVPGVWALDWGEMSPTERGINAAVDALIMFPLVRASIGKFAPLVTRGGRYSMAVNQFIKQENQLAKQTTQMLRTVYGRSLANDFKVVVATQRRFTRALVKLNRLKVATRPNPVKIEAAQAVVDDLARQLQRTTQTYVTNLKYATRKGGAVSTKFDSPLIMEQLDDLPKVIVENTRNAVEGLRPSADTIKVLKADVAKAQSLLDEYQLKYPTDPSKWADLLADLAIKENKLSQALGLDISALHQRLVRLRGELPNAKGAARTKIQAEIYELEAQLDKAYKAMAVEWGRSSPVGGRSGGVAVAETRTRPRIGTGGRVRTATVPTTVVSTVVAPHLMPAPEFAIGDSEIAEVVTKATPEIIEIAEQVTLGETNPDVIREAQRIASEATRQAVHYKLEGKTAEDIRTRTEELVRQMVETQTELSLKAALEGKVKAITRTALKVATKVAVKVKAKVRIRVPILIPDAQSGKKRPMTKEEIAGAIAWKQGFIYIMLYPPYGQKNVVYSRTPIKGVKLVKGARSAYQSIVRLGGVIPALVKRDMGIMDIEIRTPKKPKNGKRKPVIRFKRDRRQRTKTTPVVGGTR